MSTDSEKLVEVANALADLVDEEYIQLEKETGGETLMDGKVDTPLYQLWRSIADHFLKQLNP